MSLFSWRQIRCFLPTWACCRWRGEHRVAEHVLDYRKTHLNIFHQIAFFYFKFDLAPFLPNNKRWLVFHDHTARLALSEIREWRLEEQLCGREWQVWIPSERRVGGGSHSLSMRGAEIALKMTSRGVMVVIQPFLALTWLHSRQVLFSIISGLVGRHIRPLFVSDAQMMKFNTRHSLFPPVFGLRMELKFSNKKKMNRRGLQNSQQGVGWWWWWWWWYQWMLRVGTRDERDVKSSKCRRYGESKGAKGKGEVKRG